MADHSESYNPYFEVAPGSPPSFSPLSPNRAPKGQLSHHNTLELKGLPTLPSQATAPKLGYYPASLAVLAVWLVFIIILVWLLESAVAHGLRSLTHPWAYTTLPSLLITVFAQGHGAVTAMHLSRVSVSALHSPRTSPNTWAEVFWISDRAWQGPVGILSTFLAASRMRVRTSTHFIICAVTCLAALVTPIILSRAYPIRSIVVEESTTITPYALSVPEMGAVDAYAEMGTGVGSWTAALSVADVYNSSLYLPPGVSRDGDPTDFFFAGNIDGKTVTLPGLRLRGQCVPIDSTVASFADLPPYCQAQMGGIQFMTGVVTLSPVSVNFSMQACTNRTWDTLFPPGSPSLATNVAYIYINSANTSVPSLPGIAANGMIRCDSQTSTGTAQLSGANGTYSSFSEQPLYNATQGGEPLIDPLYALFYYFGSHKIDDDDTTRAAVVRALGFTGVGHEDGSQTYAQPSLQEMATGLWRGVSYIVAGVGLLSRTNDTPYPAVQSGLAAVYVRESHYAAAAYTLLALWLLLLIAITARSFRPTFGGSFDSYITVKLVQDKPGLVHSSTGELAKNVMLREPFGRVGRDEFGRVVVDQGSN
ncbi:hypothetical protein B0H17DRAFT_574153 [Mycena rosella]|uniref:Uncharacterized protein n=1 Tax=Mycena rosella TaxID=1033263 RepID=A0AAD7GWT8_MYCRO|nr:hypothetical protein B0H17DRAFT_574153 [Mycena rosella]